MKRYITLLLFVVFNNTLSQKASTAYNDIITATITESKKKVLVDSLLSQCDLKEKITIAHKFSINQFKKRDFNQAIHYVLYEIAIYKKLNLKNIKYSNALANLGLFYFRNHEFTKAINTYNEVIKLDLDTYKVASSYCMLGECYNSQGDYTNAIKQYKRGIVLFEKQKRYRDLFAKYNNLFIIYDNYSGKNNDKLAILQKLKKLENILVFSKNMFYMLNNNFALYYLNDSVYNFKKANRYYVKNLKKSLQEKDSVMASASYLNIAELYNREKRDSAIYFLKKGFYFEKAYQANYYYNMANYFLRVKQLKKARIAIDNSLKAHLKTDSITNKLSKNNLKKSNNKFFLLAILDKKSEILLQCYQEKKNKKYLELALQNCNNADLLIDIIRKNTTEKKSKLFWQDKVSPVYAKAMQCCYLLKNIKQAFYFIEKSKAILLIDDIATQNYALSLNIPKSLLDKERRYKEKLIDLEQITSENNDSILKLQIAYERKLQNFQDSIYQGKNPQRYTQLLTLDEVQQQLKDDEVVIEYRFPKITTNQEDAYAIFITNKKQYFFAIHQLEDLKKKMVSYIDLLRKPLATKNELASYKELSFLLFNKLFPLETKALIKNKKLYIATDNLLSFIPFESFSTQKDGSDYLLYTSEISYVYSMSFHQINKNTKVNTNKKFLGIAPVHFKYDSLPSLTRTQQEITSIQTLFSGDLLIGEKANKENFNKICNQYAIIHFATHADANNQKAPWIAFKNKKLFLPELYTTKTQADLVTLSACNSSLGEIANGEGVLSLSRGFFYSGTHSVVSSLWNVDDKASLVIMKNFYKNLKNGKTKAAALRQAKINYLKKYSLEEASPYYWSSFILVGDAGKLAITANNNLLYYFLGLSIVIILCFVWWKKYKKT